MWQDPKAKPGSLLMWVLKTRPHTTSAERVASVNLALACGMSHPVHSLQPHGRQTQGPDSHVLYRKQEKKRSCLPIIFFTWMAVMREKQGGISPCFWDKEVPPTGERKATWWEWLVLSCRSPGRVSSVVYSNIVGVASSGDCCWILIILVILDSFWESDKLVNILSGKKFIKIHLRLIFLCSSRKFIDTIHGLSLEVRVRIPKLYKSYLSRIFLILKEYQSLLLKILFLRKWRWKKGCMYVCIWERACTRAE